MKGQRNGVSGFRGLNIGTTPPFMLRSKRLLSLWFLVVSHHHWFHVEIEELQIIPWINNWLRGIRHCWLWRISPWNPKNRWKIMQTRIGGMCNSKWERKFFLSSWHTVKVSGTTEKWKLEYYGPFRVRERIGAMAYRLQLPPLTTIHNVFNVSRLKKKVGEQKVIRG